MPSQFAAPLPPARLRQPAAIRAAGSFGDAPMRDRAKSKAAPHAAGTETLSKTTPATGPETTSTVRSLIARIAVLIAAIAVPVLAAPGDFGALALGAATEYAAPGEDADEGTRLMPFEQAGASFPGSAFYYLADPPMEALVALPSADPLAGGVSAGGRDVGALIPVGPAPRPLVSAGLGIDHARAHRCLAEAIWYEAASESEAGKRAVAQVVLNRVSHPAWPGSVCGVVYQGSQRRTGCQFTFTCDGSLARPARGPSWETAKRIANEALGGAVYAPIGHATHYHTLFVNPYWAKTLDHVGTIGAHHFYRNRGRGGDKSAFTGRYSGGEPLVRGRVSVADAGSLSGSLDGGLSESALLSAAFAAYPSAAAAGGGAAFDPASPTPARNPAGSSTASPVADPALIEAGRARAKYANAGSWKRDPGAAPAQPAVQPAAQSAGQVAPPSTEATSER